MEKRAIEPESSNLKCSCGCEIFSYLARKHVKLNRWDGEERLVDEVRLHHHGDPAIPVPSASQSYVCEKCGRVYYVIVGETKLQLIHLGKKEYGEP